MSLAAGEVEDTRLYSTDASKVFGDVWQGCGGLVGGPQATAGREDARRGVKGLGYACDRVVGSVVGVILCLLLERQVASITRAV